jgi:RecA-family ATPase
MPEVDFDAELAKIRTRKAAKADGGTNSERLLHIALQGQQKKAPPVPPLLWIDMSKWDDEPVPEYQWAVLNRIPLLQTTLHSGQGAAGKSTIELHRSVAHVLGRDWLGSMPEEGPAVFIDAEDHELPIHIRLAAVVQHYGVTYADCIKAGLHLMTLAGKDAVLAAPSRSGKIEPTALYNQILEFVGDIKPKSITLASAANVFAGNESDRNQVQQGISLFTRFALVARGSVVLVSHPSLTGINSGTGLSGSTGWHNAVRARYYLRSVDTADGDRPDSDLRQLEFKKNQYGSTTETIVLKYHRGMFLPLPSMSSLDKVAREAKVDDTFLNLLRQFNSQGRNVSDKPTANSYAPTAFAKQAAATAHSIKKPELEAAMRRLFDASKIHVENYGRPSRPNFKLAIK